MGSVNLKSVLIAGLAAGVALNVVDIVANAFLWADAWETAIDALGIEHETATASSGMTWIVIDLIIGIVIAWLYASMTPRHGAGTNTGLMAGAAVWVVTALMFVGMNGMGILSMDIVLRVLVSGAVAAALGGYAASRLYKEA